MRKTKLKYIEQTVTSHCDITYVLICGKCIVITYNFACSSNPWYMSKH